MLECRAAQACGNAGEAGLVRKELVKWISPMQVKGENNSLSGRLLALRYAPPNVNQPIVFANVWMPHSGYQVAEIRKAHETFGKWVSQWK